MARDDGWDPSSSKLGCGDSGERVVTEVFHPNQKSKMNPVTDKQPAGPTVISHAIHSTALVADYHDAGQTERAATLHCHIDFRSNIYTSQSRL